MSTDQPLTDEQILAAECESCSAGEGDLCHNTYGPLDVTTADLPAAQSHGWRLRQARSYAGHGPLRSASAEQQPALSYAEAAGGGWFADLRDADGQLVETGIGQTQPEAQAHLAARLERNDAQAEAEAEL
jgi:hypothetical protein